MSHRQLKEYVLKSMSLEEIEQIKLEVMKRQHNPKVLEEVASKVSEKIVNSETTKKDEKRAQRLLVVQKTNFPKPGQLSNEELKMKEMKSYIIELESTVKNMHEDIKKAYSAEAMKDVISGILKEQL